MVWGWSLCLRGMSVLLTYGFGFRGFRLRLWDSGFLAFSGWACGAFLCKLIISSLGLPCHAVSASRTVPPLGEHMAPD